MILAPKQADRFHRLFNTLMDYVARRLMAADALDPKKIRSEADFNKALFEAVWGKDGDATLLDDYVRESPLPLSSADADEVLSWKSGLLSVFPVLREGDDVVFLYGEHAFAVCGITREIDVTMNLPAFAEGVIVPFDGLITYGTTLMEQPIKIQGNMPASLRNELRECAKTGRLARTAKEFARLVVEAREASERGRIEHEEWEASMDAAKDVLIVGQRRSPLTGVGWDERMEAFEKSRLEHEHIAVSFALGASSVREAKGTSLADCLASLTKDGLADLAKAEGLGGSFKKLKKAEMVEALAAAIGFDAHDFVVDTAQHGVRSLCTLIDVVRAGGRLEVKYADIQTLADMPCPALPVLWLFRTEHGYCLVVPDEYQERLAALPDNLFETCLKEAETLDAFLHRIEVMVQLRGVVPSAEVMVKLFKTIRNADPEFYIGGLIKQSSSGELSFRGIDMPNDPDGAYLHVGLLDVASQYDGSILIADPELVAEIMGHSRLFPARNGDEFEDLDALARWMRGHKTYQALVRYLDGCVPEGEDDRDWAVKYADGVVDGARRAYTTQDAMGLMVAEDLELSEAQYVRIAGLIGDLLNDVPKWTNNGWAPNELRDRRSQGRSMRPSAMMPGAARPGAMRPSASRSDITLTPRRPKRKRPHKKRKR